MAKTTMDSWKDCIDSRNIDRVVKSAGGNIRKCSGSHKIAEIPGKGNMTYYESKNISTGVACKIYKWLKAVGVICIIIGFLVFKSINSCGANNYKTYHFAPNGQVIYVCD